jgi:hypothetical protein
MLDADKIMARCIKILEIAFISSFANKSVVKPLKIASISLVANKSVVKTLKVAFISLVANESIVKTLKIALINFIMPSTLLFVVLAPYGRKAVLFVRIMPGAQKACGLVSTISRFGVFLDSAEFCLSKSLIFAATLGRT